MIRDIRYFPRGFDVRLALRLGVVLGVACLMMPARAGAGVHRVPGDFETIGAAIAAAEDGGLILVGPGVWSEALDFGGRSVAVISSGGPDVTTLDGGTAGNAVVFRQGEDSRARLDGFTITGTARAILCDGSSPRITGNVIRDQVAPSAEPVGAAILCRGGAAPEISGNVFRANFAAGRPFGPPGGAISCLDGSAPLISKNLFDGNEMLIGGGAVGALGANPWVEGNTFTSNRAPLGAGVWIAFADGEVVVRGNRFTDQEVHAEAFSCSGPVKYESNFEAGGRVEFGSCGEVRLVGNRHRSAFVELRTVSDARLVHETFHDTLLTLDGTSATAVNSIIHGNPGDWIELVGGATFGAEYCDILGGWPGIGNIDVAPLFVDPDDSDLRLRVESPCVDAGTDPGGLPDFDYEGEPRVLPGRPGAMATPDMGADEMELGVASRLGKVSAGVDSFPPIESVIFANLSSGDAAREVVLTTDDSLAVDVLAPISGPVSAPFVIYAFAGAPSFDSAVEQPGDLGWCGFGTPLRSNGPVVRLATWNNIGRFGRLGAPDRPSSPAPTRLFRVDPGFFDRRQTITLQGFILDDGADNDLGASVTNAVVIRIVPAAR